MFIVCISSAAQYDDYEQATVYLKTGEILVGDARIPLEGRTVTPNFKEKVRFKDKGTIIRFDETEVDSIVFDALRYSFKVKIDGKKSKRTIESRDKFVYKFLGHKFPQLVKEVKVGGLIIYEKFRRHDPGGPNRGIFYFYSPHLRTNKGLSDFGHYFFFEGTGKDLQPISQTGRFIDVFSFCPKLIEAYDDYNRKLHAFEVIELIKSFGEEGICHY
ncbi:hypothetical protein [Flagellimonas sp.]|uniref:hypothetical protein n=1 Tax=Flagellimonas sp. TaxID=2058762 RepID=UPI003B514B5D